MYRLNEIHLYDDEYGPPSPRAQYRSRNEQIEWHDPTFWAMIERGSDRMELERILSDYVMPAPHGVMDKTVYHDKDCHQLARIHPSRLITVTEDEVKKFGWTYCKHCESRKKVDTADAEILAAIQSMTKIVGPMSDPIVRYDQKSVESLRIALADRGFRIVRMTGRQRIDYGRDGDIPR